MTSPTLRTYRWHAPFDDIDYKTWVEACGCEFITRLDGIVTIRGTTENVMVFWADVGFPPIPNGPRRRPSPYAAKCKRRRTDGPTPCLCCSGECVG